MHQFKPPNIRKRDALQHFISTLQDYRALAVVNSVFSTEQIGYSNVSDTFGPKFTHKCWISIDFQELANGTVSFLVMFHQSNLRELYLHRSKRKVVPAEGLLHVRLTMHDLLRQQIVTPAVLLLNSWVLGSTRGASSANRHLDVWLLLDEIVWLERLALHDGAHPSDLQMLISNGLPSQLKTLIKFRQRNWRARNNRTCSRPCACTYQRSPLLLTASLPSRCYRSLSIN